MNFKMLLIWLVLAFLVIAQGGGRQKRSRSIKSNISMKKTRTCTSQHCQQIIKYDDYDFNVCFVECEKKKGYAQNIPFIIALGGKGFAVFLGILGIIFCLRQHLNRVKKLKQDLNEAKCRINLGNLVQKAGHLQRSQQAQQYNGTSTY